MGRAVLRGRAAQVWALTRDGWSIAQVADILGVSLAAVRTGLWSARRLLGQNKPPPRQARKRKIIVAPIDTTPPEPEVSPSPVPPSPVPPSPEPPLAPEAWETELAVPELVLPPMPEPDGPEPELPAVERLRSNLVTRKDGGIRARTIGGDRLTRAERRAYAESEYPDDVERPRTREDCANMPRPCPFVSCAHHLYLDVNPGTGHVKLNFPQLEVWEMAETCSLDVADRGGVTLEELGTIMNLTRERIRQIEGNGLYKIRARTDNGQELEQPPERRTE